MLWAWLALLICPACALPIDALGMAKLARLARISHKPLVSEVKSLARVSFPQVIVSRRFPEGLLV